MKRLMLVSIALTTGLILAGIGVRADQDAGTAAATVRAAPAKVRIGVYDNRAIAVAYAPSQYNPVRIRMKAYERAKQTGDEKTVKELEEWGESHQRQLHRQGFGRVPVDDLLAYVQDRIPDVAEQAGVQAIVFDCNWHGENVEVVDVTLELVALFDPSEKTLETVRQLVKAEPLDLDVVEQSHDH